MNSRPIAPVSLSPIGSLFKSDSTTQAGTGNSFEKVLGDALGKVNQIQEQSAELDTKLASGQLEYLHQAMIMGEKASMAMQLTVQVRNKILEAYQEVMRTQI